MISRREAVADFSGIAVGAVLLGPLQAWLVAEPDGIRAQINGPRIGMPDVARIEQATAMFRSLYNQYGGGLHLHRKALVGQLAEANDLLTHATFTAPVGQRLRTATADLCSLAGWVSYNEGQHKVAQQYWMLGVHHAHDAGDRELAAYILYEMASQMKHIGRPEDALELLQMAWYGARTSRSPQLRAQLLCSEAGAYARLGQAQETYRLLGNAEDVLSEESSEPVPDRLAYVTPAALAGGRGRELMELAVHQSGAARRGSLEAALTSSRTAVATIGDAYPGTRARYLFNAVRAHHIAGDLDEAGDLAAQLADAMATVQSRRTRVEIDRVRAELGPEPKDPRIRTLAAHLDRALEPPQLA